MKRCGIDHSNISKIEKGEINITLSSILELSKGLKVHPKELFKFNIDIS
jgi:HTH-type transcriptional repressor of puuD